MPSGRAGEPAAERRLAAPRPGVSRRQFLLEAAALGAAVTVGGCTSEPGSSPGVTGTRTGPGSSPPATAGSHAGGTTTRQAAGPTATGTLADVRHVVIFMAENRAFDHLFGSLPGVRGFGDGQALRRSGGASVFAQPSQRPDGSLRPWHMDTSRFDAQFAKGLPHDWTSGHVAWAGGAWDGWVAAKGQQTMGYLTEEDIPYHYALADAYTICDQYFCSAFTSTTPNRLYLFTGMIDPRGEAGGPAIANPVAHEPAYRWTTYPERLQHADVSWKVYANHEQGSGWVGDYACNPLWNFYAYHDALASTDPAVRQLATRASVHDGWLPDSGQGQSVDHVLADFVADCAAGALPRVSWIVAPYLWCQHPSASPDYGAHYVNRIVTALAANEELWRSTVLLLNYDENDGYFDHVPGPMPEPGTADEFVGGLPIGAGPRVAMTIVSPWTRGGWVSSQAFDHTSVLRFLEVFTGVEEPNISAWRRQVFGDLTSCFDFAHPDFSVPPLPDTTALLVIADADRSKPAVQPPAPGEQHPPTRPAGSRPARAVPYRQDAAATVDRAAQTVRVTMSNHGTSGVCMLIYPDSPADAAAIPMTVVPGADRNHTIDVTGPTYGLSIYGPDRFVRRFAGSMAGPALSATVDAGAGGGSLTVNLVNDGTSSAEFVLIANDFGTATERVTVSAGQRHAVDWPGEGGFYDLQVTSPADAAFGYRFAGRTW